jgi:hypothetical protein
MQFSFDSLRGKAPNLPKVKRNPARIISRSQAPKSIADIKTHESVVEQNQDEVSLLMKILNRMQAGS